MTAIRVFVARTPREVAEGPRSPSRSIAASLGAVHRLAHRLALLAVLGATGCAGDPLAWWLAPRKQGSSCRDLPAEACVWRNAQRNKKNPAALAKTPAKTPQQRDEVWIKAADRWLDWVVRDLSEGLSVGALDQPARDRCVGPRIESNVGNGRWSCEVHADLEWAGKPAIFEYDPQGVVALTWPGFSPHQANERMGVLYRRWQRRCEGGRFLALAPTDETATSATVASTDTSSLTTSEHAIEALPASLGDPFARCPTPGGPVIVLGRFSSTQRGSWQLSATVLAIGE